MTATMPTNIPMYSYGPQPPLNGLSGFNAGFGGFRKRCERVDWRKIASIDIDLISQTLDFSALQDNLLNITFCSIESELDMRLVDPNFIKLFKLSQLIIEYLLNSQEYLANVILDLEAKLKTVTETNESNKVELDEKVNELNSVKKESHKRRKLLTAQQQLITTASVGSNKCPYCPKSFITPSFLQGHIDKRHPDSGSVPSGGSSPPSLSATLQRELADIKARLRLTETHLHSDNHATPKSDNTKRSQSPAKWMDENKENDLTAVTKVDSPRIDEVINAELQKMRELYMKELRELSAKYESSQTALEQMQGGNSGKRSNLGPLRDEVDVEDMMTEQKQQMSVMNRNLQLEMEDMKNTMNDRLAKQDKRWQRRVQAMAAKHGEQVETMNNELTEKTRLLQRSSKIHTEELRQQDLEFNRLKGNQHKFSVQQALQRQITKPIKESRAEPVIKMPVGDMMSRGESMPLVGTGRDLAVEDLVSATPRSVLKSSGEAEFSTTGSQAISRLKRDPGIMAGMRKEVQSLLYAKLSDLGIPPNTNAVSSKLLNIKLALLKNERKGREQRFSEFKEVRQKIHRNSTNIAKDRAKLLKKSPSSPRNRAVTASPVYASPMRSPAIASQGPESPRRPPRPFARSATPQETALPRRSLQSTGSTTEWMSSQWDSDGESEDGDDDEEDAKLEVRQRKTGVANVASTPIKSHKPVPSARVKTPTKVEDWDSDDISDLEEVVPTTDNRPRVPSPRGVNVAQRKGELELKLSMRSSSKPVGGVDMMGTSGSGVSSSRSYKNGRDEDDFSDISELEDELYPDSHKKAVPGARQSHRETDNSSNTYNTSMWGSSKAPSTNDSQNPVTHDDWDSDSSAI